MAMPWSTQLAQPLVLVDGTNLVTFMDAIETLTKNFAGSEVSDAVDQAIGLLVKADKTRRVADIEAATTQLASVLRTRRLI